MQYIHLVYTGFVLVWGSFAEYCQHRLQTANKSVDNSRSLIIIFRCNAKHCIHQAPQIVLN